MTTTATPTEGRESDPGPRRTPSTSARLAPYGAALGWYAIFVLRASGTVAGGRAFPLFDDAMISMTYARNLARGHGLLWNANGPRVEGITNVLWTLLMTIPHVLHASDRLAGLFVIVLGVLLLVACAETARALVARLAPDRELAVAAAPWFVLFCYPLVYWTLRGMEVGLVTFLVLMSLLLASRMSNGVSRSDTLALCTVVAAGLLTRLDFIVFLAPVVALVAVATRGEPRRRVLETLAISVALTIGAQEVARRAYYGKWLPNTYTLKVAHAALSARLDRGLRSVVFTLLVSAAATTVFAMVALRRRRDPRLWSVAAAGAVAAAYDLYVGGDAWEWMRYANRYLTPGLVCLMCVAAVGVCDLVDMIDRPHIRTTITGIFVAVAVLVTVHWTPGGDVLFKLPHYPEPDGLRLALVPAIVILLVARPGSTLLAARPALTRLLLAGVVLSVTLGPFGAWVDDGAIYSGDDVKNARIGADLASITTPQATIAVVGAGSVIYFAHRAGIDLLGKSDTAIAEGPVHRETGFFPGHMKWNYAISIGHDRPDVIAELWITHCSDRRMIFSLGYRYARAERSLAPADADPYLVREGSTNVRWNMVRVMSAENTRAALLRNCP